MRSDSDDFIANSSTSFDPGDYNSLDWHRARRVLRAPSWVNTEGINVLPSGGIPAAK